MVLCTADRTYQVKLAETSNTLYLIPPQEGSTVCVVCHVADPVLGGMTSSYLPGLLPQDAMSFPTEPPRIIKGTASDYYELVPQVAIPPLHS